MDRDLTAVGIALILVVAFGIAAAVGPLGVLDADGGDGAVETPDSPAGATPESGDDGGDGVAGGAGTPTSPPLALEVDSIEPCGDTCRDVTATLANEQDRRATGVTVETTIYAGDDTSGDVVWEGSREVGTLEAGESETDTTRIELGWLDAAAVQAAGGEVTIETVVDTDRRSLRFVERRDVS